MWWNYSLTIKTGIQDCLFLWRQLWFWIFLHSWLWWKEGNKFIICSLKPIFSTKIESPNSKINLKTMLGSIFLGLSWGLTGMSLGPIFLLLPLKKPTLAVFWGLACLFGLVLVSVLSGLFSRKSKSEKQNWSIPLLKYCSFSY